MNSFNVLLADIGGATGHLKSEMEALRMSVTECAANPRAVELGFRNKTADAVVLEENGFDYEKVVDEILALDENVVVYVIKRFFGSVTSIVRHKKSRVYVVDDIDVERLAEIIRDNSLESYVNKTVDNIYSKRLIIKAVDEALSELSVDAKYSGSKYIWEIVLALCNKEISYESYTCQGAYSMVGKKFGITGLCAERRVRAAIRYSWTWAKSTAKVKFFGKHTASRIKPPSNKEYIIHLAQSIEQTFDMRRSDKVDEFLKSLK